ncbi:MAG: TMEM175 family protein [Cyanobacteria bacterium P01_A01_bin.123]
MEKGRLEAFSDGVLAIVITIMVLELKVPETAGLASLQPLLPTFFSYVLSYFYLGIYWNNHHHLLQATRRINGRVLWANLHLLFWLSLIPFVTGWMGENHFAAVSVALYGVVLFAAAIAYFILSRFLMAHPDNNPVLLKALGKDLKGKLSMGVYVVAIPLSFVSSWIACTLYVLIAALWLIPDRRIENTLSHLRE